jgi:hypothetical protein
MMEEIKYNEPVPFRDGLLSIQAGPYHYCYPKTLTGPYTQYEVAYIVEGKFTKIPEWRNSGDDVYGYKDKQDVKNLLMTDGYGYDDWDKILPQ